jgi:hypothetical protein
MVTTSTIKLRLRSSEGTNNYKLLHFLLLTVSFHLHPRIIPSSTLKITHFSSQSQRQIYIATDCQSISKSWCRAPSGAYDQIFIILWQLWSCFYGAPSLTRGRVCLLYMPLALASLVFLGSESFVTPNHILLFQMNFLFVASYDSQWHGGGIRSRLHTGVKVKVKGKVVPVLN